MIHKEIEAITIDADGTPRFNVAADAANDDWIRAARLKKAAAAGDKEAARQLQELEDTPMMQEVDGVGK